MQKHQPLFEQTFVMHEKLTDTKTIAMAILIKRKLICQNLIINF